MDPLAISPTSLLAFLTHHWLALLGWALAALAFYPTWHIRYIFPLLHHFFLGGSTAPTTPSHLFSPLISRSRCTLSQLDINGHKSNSTYFLDVDASRNELLALLSKHSFNARRKRKEYTFPRLGFVACQFRREIKRGQKYEVRSRVLTWDEKWVYIVTSILVPGKEGDIKLAANVLSKMIFKRGRETVMPKIAWEESGMIPLDEGKVKGWTREEVEAERRRGIKVLKEIEMMNFESLEEEVRGGHEPGLIRMESAF